MAPASHHLGWRAATYCLLMKGEMAHPVKCCSNQKTEQGVLHEKQIRNITCGAVFRGMAVRLADIRNLTLYVVLLLEELIWDINIFC